MPLGGDVGTNSAKPDIGMEGNSDFGGGITLKSAVMSMAMVLALGMLIWVKLRLVTNVPRTAYAEPEKPHVENAKPEAPKQQTADATEKH